MSDWRQPWPEVDKPAPEPEPKDTKLPPAHASDEEFVRQVIEDAKARLRGTK